MAFEKAKTELRDIVAIPTRQATIIASIAFGIAILALVIALSKGK